MFFRIYCIFRKTPNSDQVVRKNMSIKQHFTHPQIKWKISSSALPQNYFLTGFSTIAFTWSRSPFLQAHTDSSPIMDEKNKKILIPLACTLVKWKRYSCLAWIRLPRNLFEIFIDTLWVLQEVCYESSLGKGLVQSKGRRRSEFWVCDSLRNIKAMDDPFAVRDR